MLSSGIYIGSWVVRSFPDSMEGETALQSELHGIQSFQDFMELKRLTANSDAFLSMDGWVFKEVDFSEDNENNWRDVYDVNGSTFLGCTFPASIKPSTLSAR